MANIAIHFIHVPFSVGEYSHFDEKAVHVMMNLLTLLKLFKLIIGDLFGLVFAGQGGGHAWNLLLEIKYPSI